MAGPRLKKLSIRGYRSVDGYQHIYFPSTKPLVLIGENNAGKSNIVRALDLMFGDRWPTSHQPEDHEYFGRQPEGAEIKIVASVEGIVCGYCNPRTSATSVQEHTWQYPPPEDTQRAYYQTAACGHTYIKDREALTCMTIGVNRDLAYQLSYSSKWTTLAKLMRRFHDRLVEDEERVDRLKEIYASLVTTFKEVEQFRVFSDELTESFLDFGGNLQYGLGIDFSAYDPSNFFRSLRVFPHLDGMARTYEELGTGQEQVLAMAFAYAYAKAFGGGGGLMLAIEEPEAHLHPLAQQWLARKLRLLAMEGVQVIVTTHSPYFVDVASPGTHVLVRKDEAREATVVRQLPPRELVPALVALGASAAVTQPNNIGATYEATATYDKLAGFFSRGCVVVEGATEQLALPVLLERVGLDLLELGVAVVPSSGLSQMSRWVRLFKAYDIPVYAAFDTDSHLPRADREQSRQHGLDVLSALTAGTKLDAAPDQLTVAGVFACFDGNYERAMRAMVGDEYIELDQQALEMVGKSKQLRARFCARNLSGPDDRIVWTRLRDLAAAIRAAMPAAPAASGAREAQAPARSGEIARRAPRR
jgi:putative ATP-dependent endonuclease of OLD family